MTRQNDEQPGGVTWVVVADAARAEIYRRAKRFSALEPVTSLEQPEARLKDTDINADAPGRSFDSAGHGRHAMEPDSTVAEIQRRAFAAQIVDELERGRNAHEFRKLVVIAAPALLGEIREHLSDPLRALVTKEIDKDLTAADADTLRAALDA